MRHADGVLLMMVGDDGVGGADPDAGTGLRGIERRLAAFDGTMTRVQPAGRTDRRDHGAAVRVVIAEDLALLRDGLTRLLEAFDFEVVEAVDNGPALLPALIEHRPDVAVVDVRLPPTFTDEGLQAAIEARTEVPGLPVLVLSQHVEQLYARELLDRPHRRRRLPAQGPGLQRRPVRRRGAPGRRRRHRDGPRGGRPAAGPRRGAAGRADPARARGARR